MHYVVYRTRKCDPTGVKSAVNKLTSLARRVTDMHDKSNCGALVLYTINTKYISPRC